MDSRIQSWAESAEEAQRTLDARYWNPSLNMYDILTPCPNGDCNTIFHYWWMAHAVEALTDGWERTRDIFYKERLSQLYRGLLARNDGEWPNALYDDMEWMALAWLRAYEAIGDEAYKEAALVLWADIKTGWNEHMGGGIAWQKSQLDYKNTPANAPAVILAARLYRAFGDQDNLRWANKIFEWQKQTLVDPVTGFVWDGVNRQGDGVIDKDWKFTYCQGVYIGAAVEMFRATGEQVYLTEAARTWEAALDELTSPESGLFPAEGQGDGGLFKGIFARYAAQLALALANKEGEAITAVLLNNAATMWRSGRSPRTALFGAHWDQQPSEPVDLSTQLCGVILLEAAALLENKA